jgi:hypothetical protein
MWPGPYSSSSTATVGANWPLPPRPPEADLSQQVARHLGMVCLCSLIDCCHQEMPEDNYAFRHCSSGVHVDSGSPASGFLYPWEPEDESWREYAGITGARTTATIQKR